jgi:hypothetical protein
MLAVSVLYIGKLQGSGYSDCCRKTNSYCSFIAAAIHTTQFGADLT